MMDLDKVREAVRRACGLHLDADDTADEVVRVLSAGPAQDELVGRQIADQMIAKIDAIAPAPAVTGWRDISSAPKDGRPVDLWVRPHDASANGNPARIADAWWRDGAWMRFVPGEEKLVPVDRCGVPTHWMTPPTLPAVTEPAEEAVAWRHDFPGGRSACDVSLTRLSDEDKARGWVETPLYAHPAPEEAARLRARVAELELALKPFSHLDYTYQRVSRDGWMATLHDEVKAANRLLRARSTLAGGSNGE